MTPSQEQELATASAAALEQDDHGRRADRRGVTRLQSGLASHHAREPGTRREPLHVDAPPASPQTGAAQYLAQGAQERFDGIVTDAAGTPLAIIGSFKGQIDSAMAPASIIVAEAFSVEGAAAVWFAHNHPSRSAVLSDADKRNGLFDARAAETLGGNNLLD